MIRALIFDFDGLILDTEVPDFVSWQEIYEAHNCELPFAEWAACIGTADATFDPYTHLETQVGAPLDRETIRSRRRARYAELVAVECVLPGVEAVIAEARGRGLSVGLASSSTREWVLGHLNRLGLHAHFDCVRCSDDVRRTKPDPELYLAAVGALGLKPEEAIAIEDSPNGVLAAKRAGLFCVAVPNRLTCGLALDRADLRLSSLAEMPLDALLQAAERRGAR